MQTYDLGVAMQCALHENRQAEKNAEHIYLSAPLTGGHHMEPPELRQPRLSEVLQLHPPRCMQKRMPLQRKTHIDSKPVSITTNRLPIA